MAATVAEVCSEAELQALCSSHAGLTTVLLWAPWHPPSVHLGKVLEAIAVEQKSVRFAKVNTDVCPSIATSMGADQVPFVVLLNPRGSKLDSVAGADPPKLVEKVKAFAGRSLDNAAVQPSAGYASKDQSMNDRLKELINFSPVMLFMKGSKVEPFCKFSKQAVAILDKHDIEYSTFDILQDEEVRQNLKEYSNWKTYPQFYIDGELIGGVDILKEMDEDGSLLEAVGSSSKGTEKPLNERLQDLIKQSQVMLFMKGNPEQPRCGFSGKIVKILQEKSIEFGTFDILSDEEVRQGLKEYSNWPTYPQLYAKGKLIGGLDIVKELDDEGSLEEELS